MSQDRKHILIVGLGKSGLATVRYCMLHPERYRQITLVDGNCTLSLEQAISEYESGEIVISVHLGVERVPQDRYDLAVVSPGIAPHSELFRSICETATTVISEVEFAYTQSKHRWVAITGSNGKTTTTALTAHLLCSGGIAAKAVGNIGLPAIEAIATCPEDMVLVAEVSSFQLYLCDTFAPDVSAILNITPDHLDWHGSMDDYVTSKLKVFAAQSRGDRVLLYHEDEYFHRAFREAAQTGAEVVSVALDAYSARPLLTERNSALLLIAPDGSENTFGEVEQLQIKGAHNVVNALFAVGVAQYYGIDALVIEKGLHSFEPVPHRLQFVRTVDGVDWYNDSKATNPDAVYKAVDALEGQPITLLLGGRNKGNDFSELLHYVSSKVDSVLCFGEAGAAIYDTAKKVFLEIAESEGDIEVPAVILAHTMQEALVRARVITARGGSVLLSPACASFDEFTSYQHRGETFAAYVNGLASEGSDE